MVTCATYTASHLVILYKADEVVKADIARGASKLFLPAPFAGALYVKKAATPKGMAVCMQTEAVSRLD